MSAPAGCLGEACLGRAPPCDCFPPICDPARLPWAAAKRPASLSVDERGDTPARRDGPAYGRRAPTCRLEKLPTEGDIGWDARSATDALGSFQRTSECGVSWCVFWRPGNECLASCTSCSVARWYVLIRAWLLLSNLFALFLLGLPSFPTGRAVGGQYCT